MEPMTIKTATVRAQATKRDDGTYRFRITTPTVDRAGDVVETSGGDWTNFLANPVVLYGHDYGALPVGRGETLTVGADFADLDVRFASEIDEFAGRVERHVAGGWVRTCSIGFRPLDLEPMKTGGYRIKRWEMLELSIVPIPCNADALARGLAAGKAMVPVGEVPAPKCEDATKREAMSRWVKSAPCAVDADAWESTEHATTGSAAAPALTVETRSDNATWIVGHNDWTPAWAKALTDELAALRAEVARLKTNTGPTVPASAEDEADPDETDDDPAMTEALTLLVLAGLED